jgi:hypothetical protein
MTIILIKILMAGGVLATIYRIYLAIVQGHEKAVLSKDDTKVQQDLGKDSQDAKTVQASDKNLAAAINKFDSDNK